MSRFQVGQRVRVIACCRDWSEAHAGKYIGKVGTVASGLRQHPYPHIKDSCHIVDLDDEPNMLFAPHHLEPLRDDDSHQLTTWEAVRKATGWSPAGVTA